MRKEYKTIPGPKVLVINSGDAIDFRPFQDLINSHAVDGWVFHSMENVAVEEKPGCLSALFGGKPTLTNFYMFIFERDI